MLTTTTIGPTVQCRAPPARAEVSSPQELSHPAVPSLAGGKEQSPWDGSARLCLSGRESLAGLVLP